MFLDSTQVEQVDAVYRLVTSYPQVFGFAGTADELERVWSAGDLQKLAGRNILRVMRAVEDAATEPHWPESP